MIDGAARQRMQTWTYAGGFLISVALSALPALAQEANVKVINMTIASSGAHKECLSLAKTQSLRYWFRSEAPIDFNVQYQAASGVVYAVKRDRLSMGTGTYAAKTADVHCMVLTNPAKKPATVRLEFARVER